MRASTRAEEIGDWLRSVARFFVPLLHLCQPIVQLVYHDRRITNVTLLQMGLNFGIGCVGDRVPDFRKLSNEIKNPRIDNIFTVKVVHATTHNWALGWQRRAAPSSTCRLIKRDCRREPISAQLDYGKICRQKSALGVDLLEIRRIAITIPFGGER